MTDLLARASQLHEIHRLRMFALLVPTLSDEQRLHVAKLAQRTSHRDASLLLLIAPARRDPALGDLAVDVAATCGSGGQSLPDALLAAAEVATAAGVARAVESAKAEEDDVTRASVLPTLADRLTGAERRELRELGIESARRFLSEHPLGKGVLRYGTLLFPDELADRNPPVSFGFYNPLLQLVVKLSELPEAQDAFLTSLEIATRAVNRDQFAYLVGATAPALARLGGPEALIRISEAVGDTLRWWP
ncbi:hypothetical protein [Saccharothrix xinjiangensis]|uniref:Uncharacterized protein n=1 Tax=Saccharothrix xinjiangensis TaxID=204798 RepID=A0ABV9YDP4_9PSEU